MRLFIGIALADDVRAGLAKEIRDLQRAGASVRWCAPETIHLTLKFIGECDDEKAAAIAEALAGDRLRVGELGLRIVGLGHFGRGSEVRVVWAGIEPLAGLTELHARIEAALTPLHVPCDDRPFTPHITLGRGRGGDCRALLARLEEKKESAIAVTAATACQLFESCLTPQGPIHTVRREYSLA